MATEQKTSSGVQGQQAGGGEIGSPVSNDAYNIISALHEKLEGLDAYRKYAKDGDLAVWKELTQLDQQAVMRLVDQLEQLVKDGKLRSAMAAPRPTARS